MDAAYDNNSTLVATPILSRPGISILDSTATESDANGTNALLSVQLSYPTSQGVSVNYATADGSAKAGSDYQSSFGTLIMAPGTTNLTISIPILGDLLSESNEFYFVNLADATNAIIARSQGSLTIKDNDPLPSLTISDVAVGEGNSGTTNAVFTVTLSEVSGRRVTVNYQTTNGTATAGSDYVARTGTLTFLSGVTNQTIAVPVVGDRVGESDEVFYLNLRAAVNATIARGQAVGDITNDDPITLHIDDTGVLEDDTNTVHALFSVRYATANGTATAGSDYVAQCGMLAFPPAATNLAVAIPVLGDRLVETNEEFYLDLSAAVNASIAGSRGAGTILNEDGLPGQLHHFEWTAEAIRSMNPTSFSS